MDSTGFRMIELADIWYQLKKSIWLVIVVVLLFGFMGYAIATWAIIPQYESAVTMIVNTKQENTKNITNDNITSAQNLVDTYSIIIKSNTVLNQVIKRLNLSMRYQDLEKMVNVTDVDNTQIMRVSVVSPDPKQATKIVQQIAKLAPDIIVDTAEAGSCKVISQVMESEKPIYPNKKRYAMLFSALGLLFVMGYIIVQSALRETHVVDNYDVEKYLGLQVIGVIPEVEGSEP